MLLTMPSTHSSSETDEKALKSATPRPPPTDFSFILRLSLLAAVSTWITRTLTSSPTATTCVGSSTRSSPICEMCTNPWAIWSLEGACTWTKAPKGMTFTTVPDVHSSSLNPSNKPRSACAPRAKILFGVIDKVILPFFKSDTQTETVSPTLTWSSTFSTNPSATLLLGTRPCCSAPKSTNAPKSLMLITTPSNFWPTFNALMLTSPPANS
mmetsp:Transcript_98886/g.247977  ORF Transcript_98886/g.247977 Transcript_98886/m.247977 type:complete len:211 (-) Transcript_98886:312-944(-)